MHRLRPTLLKSPIFWVLFVLVASIFGATFLISLNVSSMARNQAEADAGQRLSELAFQMSDKADRSINERYLDVQTVINSNSLTAPGTTLAQKQAVVSSIAQTYPEYSFIGITDTAGKVLVSKDNLLLGQNVSKRPWFTEASAAKPGTLIVDDVHEALLLATLLPANTNGDPLRFIDVAGPLYSGNTLMGVFAVHLSFNWVDDIRSSLIRPAESRDNADIIVLSKDNAVLLGPSSLPLGTKLSIAAASDASVGKGGVTTEFWPDGKQYVTGYYGSTGFGEYDGLGWKVLVRQPISTAYAQAIEEADRIRLSGIVLGSFIALVSFIIIAAILRRERAFEQTQHDFISIASHQLRTPVSAIGWNVELLRDGSLGQLNQSQRGTVDQIFESHRHTTELLNALLDASRLDSGKIENIAVKTSLNDIYATVVRELQPLIASKRLRVTESLSLADDTVVIDPNILRMILQNLVSNAVKYTPEHGAVKVDATRKATTVTINVHDSGIGIPRKDKKKIFSKMFRASNAVASVTEGTGLGLYIIKEVVGRLGGRVWFTSNRTGGTTFSVSLPTVTKPLK